MTEVGPADRSMLLRSKRAECSAIVTSRKRKLRELFAVATEVDGVPNHNFKDPDAPPTTPAESQFLIDCDILQGRSLNENAIPARAPLRLDTLKRLIASVGSTGEGKVSSHGTKKPLENGVDRETKARVATPDSQGASSQLAPAAASGAADDAVSQAPVTTKSTANPASSTKAQSHPPPIPSPPPTEPFGSNDGRVKADPEQSTEQAGEQSVLAPTKANGTAAQKGSSYRDEQAPLTPAVDVHTPPTAPMEVDSGRASRQQTETERATGRLAPAEGSKAPDILSSPGSTAQTVATPTVQGTSTDTSPDHEGLHYDDKERQASEPDSDRSMQTPTHETAKEAVTQARVVTSITEAPSAENGVEAQLLLESAAAKVNRSETVAGSVPPVDSSTLSNGVQSGSALQPSEPESSVAENHGSPEATGTGLIEGVSTAEIPDSQQDSPDDTMDIDKSAVDDVSTAPAAVVQQTSTHPEAEHSNIDPQPSSQGPMVTDGEDQAIIAEPEVLTSLGPAKHRQKRAKGSHPTVVFGKIHKTDAEPKDTSIVAAQTKTGRLPTDDYFTTLFIQGFAQHSKWMKPVEELLKNAHKTISTPDSYTSILEQQACRVLRRVYHLQQQDKWSLRQPKRCLEPARNPSHWDVLLQEMKWMRTDFRQERKWKRAVARSLALACAEWVASDPAERKALQVNATIPPLDGVVADVAMEDAEVQIRDTSAAPTPDLIPSGDSDSPAASIDDHHRDQLPETVAPAAIFAMPDDEVVFGLQKTPAADRLLDELPLYGTPLKIPVFDITGPEFDPDAHWRRPALPLSKYVEGQMVLASSSPPRKRGRFHYEAEEEDDDDEIVFGMSDPPIQLGRENKDVALFDPEMKPIRDRLHAGHQFRPPAEHGMPLQSFYECRSASQWTMAEDDDLKALVREHSYNWSLISSILSTKSMYVSGPERRTPWECFERWVHLEGLPNDMAKTQYFKTYQNRIDTAQRTIMEHNQKVQQQAAANGAATPVQRRRPTTTMRVERRRNQKHLALIDAMRKLAKKRETTLQKQQHAANLAAMRKQNEPPAQRGPNKTPRDYSLMRWERDQQLAEKMAQYAQRQQEQQRRALAARAQGQVAAAAGNSTPVPPQVAAQMAAANSLANAARANGPGQMQIPGQPRPRMPMQVPVNGMAGVQAGHMPGGLVPPMPINGMPTQAQLQVLQQQQRLQMPGQAEMAVMMQARRIQDQQRQTVQMQQAQQHPSQQQQPQQVPQQQQPQGQGQQQQQQLLAQQQQQQQQQQVAPGTPGSQGSPPPNMRPVMNNVNQQTYMANAQAMLAQMNANAAAANGNGMATPPAGTGLSMPTLPAGSPRGQMPPVQQVSPAVIQHFRDFEASVKAKNPNLPTEQLKTLVENGYRNMIIMQRANAMQAAAGGAPQQALVNGMPSNSPHQYAARLIAQQQAQQAAAAAAQQASQHQRQASAGATPAAK